MQKNRVVESVASRNISVSFAPVFRYCGWGDNGWRFCSPPLWKEKKNNRK